MDALLERLLWVVDGGNPNLPPGTLLLRGALIGCSLFALVQLLTMLATRWGDRNAQGKSLIASLVLHIWFGLAWATVAENRLSVPLPAGDEIAVRQPVNLMSEDDTPTTQEGNVPTWTPATTAEPTLTRQERTAEEAPLPEVPALDQAMPLEVARVAELKTTPDEAVAQPELIERQTPVTNTAPAAIQATAEATADARSEASLSASPASRSPIDRATPTSDDLPETLPSRGMTERIAANTEVRSLPALPADPEAGDPQPAGAEAEMVVRKSAPVGELTPDNAVGGIGSVAQRQPGATKSNSPFQRQSTRSTNVATREAVPGVTTGSELAMTRPDSRPFRELPEGDTQPAGPAAPQPVRPNMPTNAGRKSAQMPATYRLRRLEQRRQIAVKNGGTEKSERAVEASLKWLASVQESDGRWDSERHGGGTAKRSPDDPADLVDRKGSGRDADTGVTGLTILAFLGAGYTHEEGQYADNVRQALDWLIAKQRSDGYLGFEANYYDAMYCHAIGTYAMAEAFAMQSDRSEFPALRDAVAKAAGFIVQLQNKDGGWRYRKGMQESDMSMFGWQLMALKSAENAGLVIPNTTRQGMIEFLKDRGRGNKGGLAGYRDSDKPTPAMTAESLFCKQMIGIRRTNPACVEAVEYLGQNLPRMSRPNDYYWYYGTLAMFQYGGQPWIEWNESLRDALIRSQKTSGPTAGTWDPVDPWGGIGGRVYSTALSTLCLEVYYRFLPLYRLGETEGD